MAMPIDAPATVISAIVGAGVGGLVTLIGQWLTRRSEERRHLRELVIRTAVEDWKYTSEALKKLGAERPPIDSYILRMVKLVEVLETPHLTPEIVRRKLSEVHAITRAAAEEIERFSRSNEAMQPTDGPA
jgi:hypothetical protein